jgi:hypothetical protein
MVSSFSRKQRAVIIKYRKRLLKSFLFIGGNKGKHRGHKGLS